MQIKDLRDKMRKVNIEAKVTDKSEAREVTSRFKNETYKVATAMIADDTGTVKLTLWNDQIDQVKVNDTVEVQNGYIISFRGEIQLNTGKYGKLKVK